MQRSKTIKPKLLKVNTGGMPFLKATAVVVWFGVVHWRLMALSALLCYIVPQE